MSGHDSLHLRNEGMAQVASAFDSWSAPDCTDLAFVSLGWTTGSAGPGDGRVTLQWVGHDWTTFGPVDAAAT
jgi:hypothetical protein